MHYADEARVATGAEQADSRVTASPTSPRVYWNLSVPALYEEAVRRREGLISAEGPLVCRTGQHTGRSPNDKFIVREPSSADKVWWSKVNRPIEPRHLRRAAPAAAELRRGARAVRAGLLRRRRSALPARRPHHHRAGVAQPVRAAHVHRRSRTRSGGPAHTPEFTVIDVPGLHAEPAHHGTNSEVFILLNFAKRLVLIGGTSYAGEIKKSIFTVMNYLLPLRNVLSMHCSANVGPRRRRRALLRAVGHGQDDAVERSGAQPDRRRRARLERGRRLQHRGRLLRQDDPAVGRSRAADLRDDASGSAPCSRTSRWTRRRASSISTTTR